MKKNFSVISETFEFLQFSTTKAFLLFLLLNDAKIFLEGKKGLKIGEVQVFLLLNDVKTFLEGKKGLKIGKVQVL